MISCIDISEWKLLEAFWCKEEYSFWHNLLFFKLQFFQFINVYMYIKDFFCENGHFTNIILVSWEMISGIDISEWKVF